MPCALNNSASRIPLIPANDEERYNLFTFLENKKKRALKILKKKLRQLRAIKWYLTLNIQCIKTDSDGDIKTSKPYFSNKCIVTLNKRELKKQLKKVYVVLFDRFADWLKQGSGWYFDENIQLIVNIGKYRPLKGTSYFKLPPILQKKKAVINIKNDADDYCFVWCVLAALYPAKIHPERVSHYRSHITKLNLKGLSFPIDLDQIPKFEKQNEININVYEFDKEVYPLYISKLKKLTKNVVNLLLLTNENKQTHYCLIKSLSRLLRKQGNYSNKRFYCTFCLHAFTKQTLLDKHASLCKKHTAQKVDLPTLDRAELKFKNFHKQQKLKFAIYADFESLLVPITSDDAFSYDANTTQTHKHVPCAFSYVVISSFKNLCKPPVVYRGKDVVDKFMKCLLKEEDEILDILYKYTPLKMTTKDWDNFLESDTCHICLKKFSNNTMRVRDHCHITGVFRGAAHPTCNIQYKLPKKIPVVLHNLKNYDGHIIMQGMKRVGKEKIKCIPNNMEKYITFSIGKHLIFLDSFQFLSSSLDTLVNNLQKEGPKKFSHLTNNISDIKAELLLKKQSYPYEYMDSWEKLDETALPSKKDFYSSLTEESITDADYKHAQTMWVKAGCKTLGDLCDFYVKTDVLLLACVMENFRDVCLKYYKLDPFHFVSLPGFSFEACLKFTNAKLELLTDPEMYLFIESGIRGGISVVSHRFAEANNDMLRNYDTNKPESYIAFYDANGLYSWALTQPLPISNFEWITDEKILNALDLKNIGGNGRGYFFEVDLQYPTKLHDKHNLYPLAPEKIKIKKKMLSPYLLNLLSENNVKYTEGIEKLVPNLNDKCNYVVHYKTLQLYIELGLVVKKVHRAITFLETPWVKPYIEFNNEKRKKAQSVFEQDLFKLMNNSFFGKTIENVRKRERVELVTTAERLTKLVSKPTFNTFKVFNEHLVGVHLRKLKVMLDKPIYIGFACLDLSKWKMYFFHYKIICKIFGDDAILCITDTDSALYIIFKNNIYKIMKKYEHIFDTSNYPKGHFLFNDKNKKKLGLFKDEMGGKPIYQFVGLRPKLYSVLLENNENKKAARGVKKAVIKKHLRHEQYLNSLLKGKMYKHSMKTIRSLNHELYTLNVNKISLSPLDDKRYLLKDGIHSLAYGHFRIKRIEQQSKSK